jgi:UDP-N-acetylglucosamine pyrophosphorylase
MPFYLYWHAKAFLPCLLTCRLVALPSHAGGIYRALVTAGVLADMERRGIQHIHAFSVDNALVRVADPSFVGYCALNNSQVGLKVVAKTDPEEVSKGCLLQLTVRSLPGPCRSIAIA